MNASDGDMCKVIAAFLAVIEHFGAAAASLDSEHTMFFGK